MTTPNEQAGTLRSAIDRQHAAQETGRQIARDLAAEREAAQPAEDSDSDKP